MLRNIHGIVLRTVKYGDSGLIVDLFTESHGRQSFMTRITRTRHSSNRSSMWGPLAMVDFQADIRPESTRLPQPKDVSIYYNYSDIPFSPIKSTIVMFLAEFLTSALRSETENTPLYKYIETSLQWLDTSSDVSNFHISFILNLTRFLGIYPNTDDTGIFFDLLSSTYTSLIPKHQYYLRPEEATKVKLLLRMRAYNQHIFKFSRIQRQRILDILITYYRLHVPQFPELKSLDVLKEIFD